jgi:transaldolase / glucose-6-phosphate isomerase
VADLAPPRYLADMGYLPYSDAMDAAVKCLRAAVRDASGAVTAYGYGPRFLHSTGQLHKGRPATGIFLQLLHAHGEDVEIPGEPCSLGRLIDAHGDGDLDTPHAHGQPTARVVLHSDDPVRAIDDLVARLR